MIGELGLAQMQPQLYAPVPFFQESGFADSLPCVPALVTTRLQLRHLLQETCIDLHAASQVILSDPGATLQVFRLIAEEFGREEDRPTLIPDGIASLGVRRCYDAICAASCSQESAIASLWEHSRRVAECTRDLAQFIDGVSPAQAYLVGLLKGMGKLPGLLAWRDAAASPSEESALAVLLAYRWQLPAYLRNAMHQQQEPTGRPYWTEILQVAEQLASVASPSGSNVLKWPAKVSHQSLMMA